MKLKNINKWGVLLEEKFERSYIEIVKIDMADIITTSEGGDIDDWDENYEFIGPDD